MQRIDSADCIVVLGMRLFLIGGFLGSGKTTSIEQAARIYRHQQKRVGVITNDQGSSLVDSGIFKSTGAMQGEILNGCFCCRFNEFQSLVRNMMSDIEPHYLFAEAVGSCTDLVASVVKPLVAQGFRPSIVFSVFADASMLSSILRGEASFINDDVQYIYRQQLAEADIIVVSKTDLLEPGEEEMIRSILLNDFAGKKLLFQSAFNEPDILNWLNVMETWQTPSHRSSLRIDYAQYTRGELSLAWMDETIVFTSTDGSSKSAAYALTQMLYKKILAAGYPIGHLKFLLDDGTRQEKISYTTVNRQLPRLASLEDNADHCSVLINARVQCSPEEVDGIVRSVLNDLKEKFSGNIQVLQSSHFRPGIPTPVWRL